MGGFVPTSDAKGSVGKEVKLVMVMMMVMVLVLVMVMVIAMAIVVVMDLFARSCRAGSSRGAAGFGWGKERRDRGPGKPGLS